MCSENETVKDVISQLQDHIQFESDTKSDGTEQEGKKKLACVLGEFGEGVDGKIFGILPEACST